MTHTRPALSFLAAAALATAMLLVFSTPCAAEKPDPNALLDSAQKLIAKGKAADARAVLEQITRSFPGDAPAFQAADLIHRIRSIEVFIDLTHHHPDAVAPLLNLFRESGYGHTLSSAYLPSVEPQLSSHELVVLWQEAFDVPYDDAEYAALAKYAKAGGRVLLISSPAEWLKAHPGQGLDGCPILRLAKRFGLALRGDFEEVKVGKGAVFHFCNTGLLSPAKIVSKERRQALAVFERALPYEKLEPSTQADVIAPEASFKVGRITLFYAMPLETRARVIEKALPVIAESYRRLFEGDLATDVHIYAIASGADAPAPAGSFNLPLFSRDDAALHDLAGRLFAAWLEPGDKNVRYPSWLSYGFAQAASIEPLKKLGVRGVDERVASDFAMLSRAERHGGRVDINRERCGGDAAWEGKCIAVYQALAKTHGPAMLPALRRNILLYARAGMLPENVSTNDAVRYLSLSVGKDLFGFFRSVGTNVQPAAIDFAEPEKLREALGDPFKNEETERKLSRRR
jgi:hypothetical protein